MVGRQITERGIGNGISIIIFAGIARDSRQPLPILSSKRVKATCLPRVAVGCSISICSDVLCCIVERGQRRIVVNYAKRQQGRLSMLHRAHIYR